MTGIILTVMRLTDMHRVHPKQIESKCARCSEVVAVYPSGQQIMADHPGDVELVCSVCQYPPINAPLAPGALLEPFESEPKKES